MKSFSSTRRNKIFLQSHTGFTMMEILVVVATLGILAMTASAAFDGYRMRSKTSEVVQAVSKLAWAEAEYYTKNTDFLAAGPTNVPPASVRTQVDFAGSDPNWRTLAFEFQDPIYYGYQVTLPAAGQADCAGIGDLDGDLTTSLFRVRVTAASDGKPVIAGLYIFDELE